MNISKLQDNLKRLFDAQGHRLVFWYDPEQAFTESLPELELGSVQVLDLKDWPFLELKVWHGWTKDTAKTGDEMEFWIPKGVNRFHFLGGSKFIHGGASLQEVTIPVIAIREMKGKEVSKSEVRKTGVSILGSSKKITSTTSRFQFIQTEAVTDRIKPRSLLISIRDSNELISNEEKLTFDSRSQSLDDRKKSVKLTLKPRQYQSNQDYYLVMRDSENQIEYERIPFKIDLAFIDEF